MKPTITEAILTPTRAPEMARTVVIGDFRSINDFACLAMVMGRLQRRMRSVEGAVRGLATSTNSVRERDRRD